MSSSDIISINRLTLILEIIGQCDVKHMMTLPIKNYSDKYRPTSALKVLTYIITSIPAPPLRLDAKLMIMSVLSFKTDVIFYLSK